MALLGILSCTIAAQEGSFSWFALFLDQLDTGEAFYDGWHLDGPFMANGAVRVVSSTPGRDNVPWFARFTLASDYYLCGWGSTQATVPHPEGGNLWLEPFEAMQQGAPHFVLGATAIPFSPDDVNWQVVRAAAQVSGLYIEAFQIPDGSRILLTPEQFLLRTSCVSPVETFELSDLQEPVVWLDNSAYGAVFLKGQPDGALVSGLTIGTQGNLYIAGPLEYDTDSEEMLGLLTVYGDLFLADDPDNCGYPDWDTPFDIETDQDFTFCASMIALDGVLRAENLSTPNPLISFTLLGGLQCENFGYTCTPSSGFEESIQYDPRLHFRSPPWYPGYEVTGISPGTPFGSDRLLIRVTLNPFSTSTVITVAGSEEPCEIRFYDSAGRMVDRASTSSISSGKPPGCRQESTSPRLPRLTEEPVLREWSSSRHIIPSYAASGGISRILHPRLFPLIWEATRT
jgi:hypothetical protein